MHVEDDAVATRRDRRYVGTSHLFNMASNHEFVSGLDVRLRGDTVEAAISSAIEPNRKAVLSVEGLSGRGIRDLLSLMEREAYRARRQAGEFAIPKPKPKRSKPEPAICPGCGGRGGNEDEDGNWVTCEACGG